MRKFLKQCLGVLVTAVIVAAAFELVLQAFYRAGIGSSLPYGIRVESPDAPRADKVGLKPGFTGTSRDGILYAVNEFGFRDDPIDKEAVHVLFLGDSTTFGLSISHEDTYPELCECELRGRGLNVQSVNTATPGQATLDERDVLLRVLEGGQLNVGAVVLAHFANDFPGNMSYAGLKDRPTRQTLHWSAPIRRLRTWRVLRELWGAVRDSRAGGDEGEVRPPLDERCEYSPHRGLEVERDWLTSEQLAANRSLELTLKTLDEIADCVSECSMHLVFVYMPTGADEIRTGRCPRYKELLHSHVSSRDDVAWVDACRAYRSYMESTGCVELPDGFYSCPGDAAHPGPEACAVLAAELADLLEEQLRT